MKAAISCGFDFKMLSILCCCSAEWGDFSVCSSWLSACFCCIIPPPAFSSPTGLTAGVAPCIGPPTIWPCDCISWGAGDLMLWPGNLCCHCSMGSRLLPIRVHTQTVRISSLILSGSWLGHYHYFLPSRRRGIYEIFLLGRANKESARRDKTLS